MTAAPIQAWPVLRQLRQSVYKQRFGADVVAATAQLHPWLSCGRVSKSIHAAADGSFLYVAAAKNASSTIRAALQSAQGQQQNLPATSRFPPTDAQKRDGQFLLSLLDMGAERFHALLADPACLKLAFVRNPYVRLASAWSNKMRPLEADPAMPSSYAVRLERTRRRRMRRLFGITAPFIRAVSFRQFAQQVCRQNPLYHDVHWMPQTDQLYCQTIRYDFIGRIETLEQDIGRVMAKLNKQTPSVLALNTTACRLPLHTLYDENLRAMVYEKYRSDFETFSYPPELPPV